MEWTARVRFLPSGVEVEVPLGTTLFQAARRAGLPVGSACAEEGICGRCGLQILEGARNLTREGALERRVKEDNRVSKDQRLSCLARVRGPVTASASYW